jgi:hypothetical protein
MSSCFEALDMGLSVTVGRRGVCLGIPPPSPIRDLLRTVEAVVGACGLAGVRVAVFEVALIVDFCGLVFGLMVGVDCCAAALRLAYGSAVAGLAISGLRGRRTGADMRDDVADAWLPEVASRDIADGGRAVADLAAVGRAVMLDEEDDFTGENDD